MKFSNTIEIFKKKYENLLNRYTTTTNSNYLSKSNINQLKLLFNKCEDLEEFESMFVDTLKTELTTINFENCNTLESYKYTEEFDETEDYNNLEEYNDLEEYNEESPKFIESKNNFLEKYYNEIHAIQTQTIKKNKNKNRSDISKDDLIKMNLKMVVHLAKKYTKYANIEDLISAGNHGLCVAYEKYKTKTKNKLTDLLTDKIKKIELESHDLSQDIILNAIKEHISYGKLLNKFETAFSKKETYSIEEVCDIISSTIVPAKFSSVAYMWIKAYMLLEIKSSCVKNTPQFQISYHENPSEFEKIDFGDDAESSEDIDDSSHQDTSKILDCLNKLPIQSSRILKMYFGIGYFEPISIKNIALKENLSSVRINQIIKKTIDDLKSMCVPEDFSNLL